MFYYGYTRSIFLKPKFFCDIPPKKQFCLNLYFSMMNYDNYIYYTCVIENMGSARTRNNLQQDPLGPSLGGGEVNPAPVQTSVSLRYIPNLQGGRAQLGIKAYSIPSHHLQIFNLWNLYKTFIALIKNMISLLLFYDVIFE